SLCRYFSSRCSLHHSLPAAHIFSFQRYGHHRHLHSFPTRRSSDLRAGLGKPQITRLLALRRKAQGLWAQQPQAGEDFRHVWTRALQAFDTAGIPPIEALSEHLLSQLEQTNTAATEPALPIATECPAEPQPDSDSPPSADRIEPLHQPTGPHQADTGLA